MSGERYLSLVLDQTYCGQTLLFHTARGRNLGRQNQAFLFLIYKRAYGDFKPLLRRGYRRFYCPYNMPVESNFGRHN